jgi:hypothetical protein
MDTAWASAARLTPAATRVTSPVAVAIDCTAAANTQALLTAVVEVATAAGDEVTVIPSVRLAVPMLDTEAVAAAILVF